MAHTFSLYLSQQRISADQIRQLDLYSTSLRPAELQILQFCQQWLLGQENFEVHTSGSTGTPKPISLSRSQMVASARQTVQALGLQEGVKALLCMNPAYIGGKMMLIRAMEHQMELRVLEAEADPFTHLPPDTQLDFTALVPLQLEAVLQRPHSRSILNRMKAVIIGGAPVSWQLRQQVQDIEARLYSTYGMTETVSHIALQPLNGAHLTPYYSAFPEIKLSQDERGCLVIEGAVTGGEKVVTNDVVELADNNQFRWVGRADNIINSGGVKIQLEKIEGIAANHLSGMGYTRNLFAWGVPDERLGQKLVLVVEGKPLPEDMEEQWRQLLARELVKYEQPKNIFYVPEFCLTPSGKIQKAQSLALLNRSGTSNYKADT